MQQKGSPCEAGQMILILILIMTVALAIGLSIVQKSLVDVSTSSKVEQSSRAFSAAEAGIEKALQENERTDHSLVGFSGNDAQVTKIIDTGLIPEVPQPGNQQAPLEIPPLAKEEVTQVWLADFNSYSNPPSLFYKQNSLDIYFGNSAPDKDPVALEITLIYHNGTKYTSSKWFLDQVGTNPVTRPDPNGFIVIGLSNGGNCGGNHQPVGGLSTYQCKLTLGNSTTAGGSPLPSGLILLRARLLYNTTSQPFAVQTVFCPSTVTSCVDYSIPLQGRIIVSTGSSGETERRVKVFQQDKVLPPYFDYAIFSAGEITK